MKKHILFFEAVGGTDKGDDGHRKDTMPMVNALIKRGWQADVIQLTDDILRDSGATDQLFRRVQSSYDAYVSRVNPGNLKEEKLYFALLRRLCDSGVIGMPHPDAMIGYGAKDALTKLASTDLVPNDTYAYYNTAIFKEKFPQTLAKGERVLKQNRGSTGEGIWRVRLLDKESYATTTLPLNTKIVATEAKDNHTEQRELGEFMDFCEQYIIGDNGMLVDMTFLPRIKEGEIRILMLYKTPVYVVHKKPAEGGDAFSATLFSGAKYRYDEPEKWSELISWFLAELPNIRQKLGDYELPLIWTADFILDSAPDGSDKFVLGEINCSCVGFTTPAEYMSKIAEMIADNIIQIVQNSK